MKPNTTPAETTSPWAAIKQYCKTELPARASGFIRQLPGASWQFLLGHALPLLAIAAFWMLSAMTALPPEGVLRDFYDVYAFIAMFGFTFIFVFILFFRMFYLGNALWDLDDLPSNVMNFLSECVRVLGWCAAFIGLPLILVRILAEPVYIAYQENAASVIGVAIATAIFLICLNMGQYWWRRNTGATTYHYRDVSAIVGKAIQTNQPDENARRRLRMVAIHEAGHALCYAALDPLPDNLELHISDIREPLQGRVQTYAVFNGAPNVLLWRMLTNIAGASAERLVAGKYATGSLEDFANWQEMAIVYLQQQYEGVYFAKPLDQLEQAHNIDMLNKLMQKQFVMVRDFLNRNLALLEEIADLAVAKGFLSNEQLAPILARVDIPDDFPRIGPEDWVKDDGSLSAFVHGMPLRD